VSTAGAASASDFSGRRWSMTVRNCRLLGLMVTRSEVLPDLPVMKKRFAEIGAILLPDSAAGFGKLLANETEKCRGRW
jgi:hypothetical protein